MKKNKALLVGVGAKYVHTNIAVRYISRYCKENGADCEFCEVTINETKANVLSKLYREDCELYGFSCYIWNIDYVLEICQSLKKLRPERKILLGGPEVSYDAENILDKYSFIDYIICGEGEAAVLELLGNLPEKRCILHCKKPLDMDSLPFPYEDKDLLSVVKGEKLIYYETSRGCPFSCSYCLSSVENGVRFLSLERAKAEIKNITECGAQTIKFVDRTFNANRRKAAELWRYCMELGGDTCFHFEVGADLLTDEDIDLLKKVKPGQFQFEIGVQTTNPDTIAEISRTMNLEVMFHNVKRLRNETSIILHLDLIAGLPMENFDSFRNSFNQVYGLSPHVLQLGFLKLLKGSRLRNNAEKYVMCYCDFAPYEVFSTNWLSFDEIIVLKAIEDVLERYHNSGRFYETLAEAIRFFSSPFDFYRLLGEYWSACGLVGQGVKRISLYSRLYEFLKKYLDDDALRHVMTVMKKDFSSWHSNGVGTPDWYKMY